MKNVLFLISFLMLTSMIAQNNNVVVKHQEYILNNLIEDKPAIKVNAYVFPKNVFEYYISKDHDRLSVYLRGISSDELYYKNKGELLQYDLKSKSPLWVQKISYINKEVRHNGDVILLSDNKKTNKINQHTGKEEWRTQIHLRNFAPNNIAFGYDEGPSFTGQPSNMLTAVDLITGESIWQRKIRYDYGWTDMVYPDDTTLLLVAGDLQYINLLNGEGWEYKTTTARKDYKKSIGLNALGLAAGLLTGTAMIYTGGNDLLSQLKSNILIEDGSLYFASANAIAKINMKSGETIWSFPFEKKEAAKSSIFIQGDTLFMLNMGAGIIGKKTVPYGKAFMAAFNKSDGQRIYSSVFSEDNKDIVYSYEIISGQIYAIRKNKLSVCSIQDGTISDEINFNSELTGQLSYFTGSNIYKMTDDGKMVPLTQSDNEMLFVYTDKEKVFSLDRNIDVVNEYAPENLGVLYDQNDKYKILKYGDDMLLINNQGERLCQLEWKRGFSLVGDMLYGINKDMIFTIDLKNLNVSME